MCLSFNRAYSTGYTMELIKYIFCYFNCYIITILLFISHTNRLISYFTEYANLFKTENAMGHFYNYFPTFTH